VWGLNTGSGLLTSRCSFEARIRISVFVMCAGSRFCERGGLSLHLIPFLAYHETVQAISRYFNYLETLSCPIELNRSFTLSERNELCSIKTSRSFFLGSSLVHPNFYNTPTFTSLRSTFSGYFSMRNLLCADEECLAARGCMTFVFRPSGDCTTSSRPYDASH
jgi:hypothetical protein